MQAKTVTLLTSWTVAAALALAGCGAGDGGSDTGAGETKAPEQTEVDEKAALDTFLKVYGPCFAPGTGFPEADEATLREAAVVRTARATADGWVPVQVFLQNSATGQESQPTFRVNPAKGVGAPQSGDADAAAVLAKCP